MGFPFFPVPSFLPHLKKSNSLFIVRAQRDRGGDGVLRLRYRGRHRDQQGIAGPGLHRVQE